MDVAGEMRLTDRQRYWLEQIKACEISGKSVSGYAAAHGFNVGAMYGQRQLKLSDALPHAGMLPASWLLIGLAN